MRERLKIKGRSKLVLLLRILKIAWCWRYLGKRFIIVKKWISRRIESFRIYFYSINIKRIVHCRYFFQYFGVMKVSK